MNGKNNMWIVKPATSSNGKGITVHNDLESISEAIEDDLVDVMKYIENPMTVKNRKNDMRIWALATDWDALTVWAFEDGYIK